ncbi:GNAT family N-acetyltransferase [uncultured Kiloniella sp.]|uniref:GNAT family N-acetyltransferase n=1 Tax=uncultured Kiloniella sp. TaxID=1133091 RepID=UPI0026017020|nr:GNAT family N-acetyltransferase [uncultured Kiloniella sp.]
MSSSFLDLLPLETSRLRIRQYQSTDLEPTRAMSQDPELRKWIPTGVYSDKEHAEYVRVSGTADAKDFVVEDKMTDVVIGEMTFHPWFVEKTWEIGWLILPEFQGRGYASEAASALLDVGFSELEIHRIVATAQPQNPASFRVMEKVGMRREGEFLQCIPRSDGTWWDEVFYAILASEYKDMKIRQEIENP